MSDVVSFAEIDSQQVELLPARTLMQILDGGGSSDSNSNSNNGGNAPLGTVTDNLAPVTGVVGPLLGSGLAP
ncbi:MAG: hypothetical protein ACRDTC_24860 [Pseudonocardiaceae bacterium]